MARSDVEVILLSFEPDAEVWMRSMLGVGVSDCYRGHDGIRALYTDIDEVFREWQWFIRAIADGGDAIAVRADFVGHGRSSGVETTVNDGGMATKLSDRGRVAWQEWFAEQGGWTKAPRALGCGGSCIGAFAMRESRRLELDTARLRSRRQAAPTHRAELTPSLA